MQADNVKLHACTGSLSCAVRAARHPRRPFQAQGAGLGFSSVASSASRHTQSHLHVQAACRALSELHGPPENPFRRKELDSKDMAAVQSALGEVTHSQKSVLDSLVRSCPFGNSCKLVAVLLTPAAGSMQPAHCMTACRCALF